MKKTELVLDTIKTAAVILFLFIFTVCNVKCDADEIIVYHQPDQKIEHDIRPIDSPAKSEIKNHNEEIRIQDSEQKSEIKIVELKSKKKTRIMLIRECHPTCDKLETCNTDNGKCEAVANKNRQDYKWSPEKEHSEIFFVGISKSGTFDPKYDEYSHGSY